MSAPRHLPVLAWHHTERRVILALAVVGAALFGASWFFPWWGMVMYAPQYPQGLELVVSLTGVTGDTGEINIINHYIGMGHLEDAAQFERAYGGWLVAGLAVAVVTATLAAGKRLGWMAALFGVGFPIGFLADAVLFGLPMAHDWRTRHRVHPAYILAYAAIFSMRMLRPIVSRTATWQSIAGWVLSLAG
jgi:hypothetical protein